MVKERAVVGTVKPTKGSGSLEELKQMLPDGIRVIAHFADIQHGTIKEFQDVFTLYEEKIAELAAVGVDLIHPAGTPPFMLLGYRRERELIETWEQRHEIPIFTSGSNQVRALRALNIKRFIGIGYDFSDTGIVAKYFRDAGFDCLGLETLPCAWEDVTAFPSQKVSEIITRSFHNHPGAEGVYIQGGKLRVLDIVEALEDKLQVPVVHPGVATCWEIQKRLDIDEPKSGYGRLLSELP